MNEDKPILEESVLKLYSTIDLINLVETASRILAERTSNEQQSSW